jgi:hypothetical protein
VLLNNIVLVLVVVLENENEYEGDDEGENNRHGYYYARTLLPDAGIRNIGLVL